MGRYRFIVPRDLEDALKALSQQEESVAVLGGGTELLVRMREGKENPHTLLDISRVGLDYIVEDGSAVTLGAMATLTDIIENAFIAKNYPVLVESAREVGGYQTRNLATVGGNLCTGLSSADMAVPLLVLGAHLKIMGSRGERIIPIDKFFKSNRVTDMNKSELLKEIIIKKVPEEGSAAGSSFIKIGKRKALRLSIINVGVHLLIEPSSKHIDEIKIAMGVVSPVPIRLYEVEEFMSGKRYNEGLLEEATAMVLNSIKPRTSFRASAEYRTDLSKVLFKRAVKASLEKAIDGGNRHVN